MDVVLLLHEQIHFIRHATVTDSRWWLLWAMVESSRARSRWWLLREDELFSKGVTQIVGVDLRRSEKGRKGDGRRKSWWSRHLADDIAGLTADFGAKFAQEMMKEGRKHGDDGEIEC